MAGQGQHREDALSEDRLTGTDKRALILWIVFALVGVWFAHRYFFQAFPEASVDFKVSRADAQSRAKKFVEGLGENLDWIPVHHRFSGG